MVSIKNPETWIGTDRIKQYKPETKKGSNLLLIISIILDATQQVELLNFQ